MNLLVNETDQRFTLYDMLEADKWMNGLDRAEFDRTLDAARELSVAEVYPTLKKGDQEGCRLENGDVLIPKSFHRLKKLFDEGGWNGLGFSKENGGQGFPFFAWSAVSEWFSHNWSFFVYTNRTMGAAYLIEKHGSEEQKKRYLPRLISGAWGGPVSVTEADAGSDLMNIETRAVKQPDGSYLLQGTKTMISN
ncbi:MAG: acyl-CoA dehydrogenase, partial [Desulfobacterales bacterium]|nr:acyl-CoA dehydrogenase [Desulfobacterales bacterium]